MRIADRIVDWLEARPEMKTLSGRLTLFAKGAGIIVAIGLAILTAKWAMFDINWSAVDWWSVAGLALIVGAVIVTVRNPNQRDDLPDNNKYN